MRRVLGLAAALLISSSACTLARFDKRSIYDYPRPVAASDEAFGRSLAAFGSTVVAGNRAELLNNGDEIFTAMVAAIGAARLSVNLEQYIFHDDRAGGMVAGALAAAARRGVEVRVLVDGTGSKMQTDLLQRLRAAGVKAAVYNPVLTWKLHKVVHRTHRKLVIVDGTVSFTGGFCIDDKWLGDARGPDEWRDVAVRVTGPVSAQMQAIFAEDWTYTTGEILAGDRFYPALAPAGRAEAQAIKTSRGDPSSLAAMLHLMTIESARETIRIQNAYFVPHRQIREALERAARRGVDVRVMVPGRNTDEPLVALTFRRHYDELLAAGVRIFEYDRTMMHSKAGVFDGVLSTIGSMNFDPRSMYENAEESLVILDRELGARLLATFAADERDSREIDLAAWRRRGVHRRLAEWLAGLLRPLY
jgi:cardiolipin synthase